METLIIRHTEDNKLKIIKKLLKELGIKFETLREPDITYDKEFVDLVKESASSQGGRIIDPKNLWGIIK
jgi:hypothetical protein